MLSPNAGFLALFGTAVAGMLFIWIVILLTYLVSARRSGPNEWPPADPPAGHKSAAGLGI